MGKRIFILYTFLFILSAFCFSAEGHFTLVIDAGHGGNDSGALGYFSKEKDINLNVALAFGRYVEKNCPDVRVVYTRKSDIFIPLAERANIANKNKADLFISIHTNALPNGAIARGVETYTLGMARAEANLDVAKRENSVILLENDYKQRYEGFNPNSSESYIIFEFMQDKYMEKSVELAKYVQTQVCKIANRADKGVHQAGFAVLRLSSMPSCLIELGFITTPDEEQFLNSEDGIDELGRGIYQAFVMYKERHDKNVSVPFVASKTDKLPLSVAQDKDDTASVEKQSVVKSQKISDENKIKKSESERSEIKKYGLCFKVQIMASKMNLSSDSWQFKGVANVDSYQEDNLFKYTCGSSSDYNEIYRLRKSLIEKFPKAFIVAFKDGKRMNIRDAIREFNSK